MYFGAIVSSGTTYYAQIYVNHNGVWTLLASNSVGTTGQGTLLFTTIGSALQLSWNGVLVASANDSSLSTGSVGLRVSQNATLANFTAMGA